MTKPIPLRSGSGDSSGDPLDNLYNTDAEQALLGALFYNNRAYDVVCDMVGRDDFAHAVHGRIFEAIGKLIERGEEASPITVAPLFAEDEALKQSGGARRYLMQLAACAVTVLNAHDYARVIADLAVRREIIIAARDIIADAASVTADRDGTAILDDGEESLFRIGGRRRGTAAGPAPVGRSIERVIAAVEAAYKRGAPCTLLTGLADLDRLVGGLAPGELCVLAGRPAMGKSCCAATIAHNLARAGKRVLIFSLEMTADELAARWLAGETGISTETQRDGRLDRDDWDRMMAAGGAINKLPLYVDDQPRLSVAQMRMRARRIRRRHGLDLIVVDHLQLIRAAEKMETRSLEVGEASAVLKAVAKEIKVPILLVSQLNRAVEGRDDKRPVLADLRESGQIEEHADIVMMLYREEYYLLRMEPRRKGDEPEGKFEERFARWMERVAQSRNRAEIIVAKNRHGRTGVVPLHFDGVRQRFTNLFVAPQS